MHPLQHTDWYGSEDPLGTVVADATAYWCVIGSERRGDGWGADTLWRITLERQGAVRSRDPHLRLSSSSSLEDN